MENMENIDFEEIGNYIKQTSSTFQKNFEDGMKEVEKFHQFVELNSDIEFDLLKEQSKILNIISKQLDSLSFGDISSLINTDYIEDIRTNLILSKKILLAIKMNELTKINVKLSNISKELQNRIEPVINFHPEIDFSILKKYIEEKAQQIISPTVEIEKEAKQIEKPIKNKKNKSNESNQFNQNIKPETKFIIKEEEQQTDKLSEIGRFLDIIENQNEQSNKLDFLNEQKDKELFKLKERQNELLELIVKNTLPGFGEDRKKDGKFKLPDLGIGKMLASIPIIGVLFKGLKGIGKKILGKVFRKALIKGIGKFIFAPILAIFAAFDFMEGFNNALEITRKDTIGAKIQAGISQILSGLTFGLIDPKGISEGIDSLVDWVLDGYRNAVDYLKNAFSGKTFLDKIDNGIEKITGGLIPTKILKKMQLNIIDRAHKILTEPFKIISNFLTNLYEEIETLAVDTFNNISTYLRPLTDKLKSFISIITKPAEAIMNGIKSIFGKSNTEKISEKMNLKPSSFGMYDIPQGGVNIKNITNTTNTTNITNKKSTETKYEKRITQIDRIKTEKKNAKEINEIQQRKEKQRNERVANNNNFINSNINQMIYSSPDMTTTSSDSSIRNYT